MKVMFVLASALALAACGQTTGSARRAPSAGEVQTASASKQAGAQKQAIAPQHAAQRCADAANSAAQAQTQAAMLGGALNMVGGFGGFGGRGGMVAAQAASVGGQVVQSQARADAQAQMQQECM
jgi:hypothetical protein